MMRLFNFNLSLSFKVYWTLVGKDHELDGITNETMVYVPTESVDLYKKSIFKNGTIIGKY